MICEFCQSEITDDYFSSDGRRNFHDDCYEEWSEMIEQDWLDRKKDLQVYGFNEER